MLYPNGTTTRPDVSSPFGPRTGGAYSFHYGADLIGFSQIRAVASGVVTFAGWMNNNAGHTVIIDHGGGVTSVYMHNASHAVARGQRVTEGQHIANMGASGNATGPCNHLEIRVHGTSVEPLGYIAARLTKKAGAASTTPTPTPNTTPQKEDEDMSQNVMYTTKASGKYPIRCGITNDTSGMWLEFVDNKYDTINMLAKRYDTGDAVPVSTSMFAAVRNAAAQIRPQTNLEVAVGEPGE